MTYSDPNRLDRIEVLVESNSQQLAQLSQTTQFLTSAQLELARSVDTVVQRMYVLTDRVDRVEQQVSQLAESQQLIMESQRSVFQNIGQLAQTTQQLAVLQERITEQQASTNAAVERLDRILDYLMRRDGDRQVSKTTY